jgi:Tfp pilus assembly protein PilO
MTPFRKKFFVHSAIFFGIIVVLGAALLFLGNKISAYATNIEMTRKQLYDWIVSLESFAAVKTEYMTKGERYIKVLENRLPEKEAIIDLRKDLRFLASTEGVSADITLNQESTISPRIGAISVSMTISGQDEDIIRFLGRLNELRYLLTIDSVVFSKRADGGTDLDVRGKVFFGK